MKSKKNVFYVTNMKGKSFEVLNAEFKAFELWCEVYGYKLINPFREFKIFSSERSKALSLVEDAEMMVREADIVVIESAPLAIEETSGFSIMLSIANRAYFPIYGLGEFLDKHGEDPRENYRRLRDMVTKQGTV